MVGGDYLPRNLQCLADDGRHVSIAVLGGAKTEIFIPLLMMKRLTLTDVDRRGRDRFCDWCRELGLACAVSVIDATNRIPDGATIEIDGSTGKVTILALP